MPTINDFICPLAIKHEITIDKTIWEQDYSEDYESGEDITVEDFVTGEELTFNKESDMVIFLQDNEEHDIDERE